MFAPRVKAPTAKSDPQTGPAPAPKAPRHMSWPPRFGTAEQMLTLQRTIGNQAVLRLLSQRAESLTGSRSDEHHRQEANPAPVAGPKTAPIMLWDLLNIPVFLPDRTSRPQTSPPLIQPKLVVGQVNDPLEHEADRVADQVMRMPAPEVSIPAGPQQISRKCDEEELQMLQTKPAEPRAPTGKAPSSVHEVLRSPGQPLDAEARAYFEPRFGHDFSAVRVHADADAAASAVRICAHAYTVGREIVFAPGRFTPYTAAGRRLLAHELAHVVQQGTGALPPSASRVSKPSDALEGEAERAADIALAGGRPRLSTQVGSVNAFGVLRQAVTPADPFEVLGGGKKLTPAEAKSLIDHYEALRGADRDAVIRKYHGVGVIDSGLTRLLAAADRAELKARRALVSDIQERVQRIAVEQTAGKTLTELGSAQGAFMEAAAKKRALDKAAEEAKKIGAPVPTTVAPSDVAAEHEKETKRTSPVIKTVTNAWDALAAIPGEQNKWNSRAAAVITKVVDACTKRVPELGIGPANLKWAPREVAQAGSNAFAFSGDPISFGMRFVETAEANPDYVVRVVVHEIAGHPEFGSRFKSYEAQIYAEAHTQVPSLGSPWDTQEEKDTFAYIGTETYAALREVPYETPLSATHAAKGLITAIEPAKNIDNKIGLIKSKYARGIAEAVLQGLYERFRIDPRISPDALALFEEVAEKHFPKALKGVPKRGPTVSFEPALGLGVERAGGRSFLYTSVEANAVARWIDTALSGGLRLDLAADDKDKFVRLSLQTALRRRLLQSLYGELRAGYSFGVAGGASSGLNVGAGLSYDFGPVQAGLIYDYLKTADVKDPEAHRGFLRLGLRF
jgi:hypothetical protein